MCWIPGYLGYPDGEPTKTKETVHRPTIEERLDEIEKRLSNLEKENIDGR